MEYGQLYIGCVRNGTAILKGEEGFHPAYPLISATVVEGWTIAPVEKRLQNH